MRCSILAVRIGLTAWHRRHRRNVLAVFAVLPTAARHDDGIARRGVSTLIALLRRRCSGCPEPPLHTVAVELHPRGPRSLNRWVSKAVAKPLNHGCPKPSKTIQCCGCPRSSQRPSQDRPAVVGVQNWLRWVSKIVPKSSAKTVDGCPKPLVDGCSKPFKTVKDRSVLWVSKVVARSSAVPSWWVSKIVVEVVGSPVVVGVQNRCPSWWVSKIV